MDTRAAERKPVNTPVKLYNAEFGTYTGTSLDISDTGVFVDIEPYIGLETYSEQKLVFPNSANSRVVFNVRFVRKSPQGVAFHFVDYETNGVRYAMSDLRKLWLIQQDSRAAVAEVAAG
ncbi:MAG: PilZ domain-containing protein [Thioalkalispiraceae bacterium]|jgi:hypothetical protein